jgi:hypothetical protein
MILYKLLSFNYKYKINSICYFGGYDYIEGEGHIKSPKDKLYETSISYNKLIKKLKLFIYSNLYSN